MEPEIGNGPGPLIKISDMSEPQSREHFPLGPTFQYVGNDCWLQTCSFAHQMPIPGSLAEDFESGPIPFSCVQIVGLGPKLMTSSLPELKVGKRQPHQAPKMPSPRFFRDPRIYKKEKLCDPFKPLSKPRRGDGSPATGSGVSQKTAPFGGCLMHLGLT